MKKLTKWNFSVEGKSWQWLAPALVTAASLGVYWAARRRMGVTPSGAPKDTPSRPKKKKAVSKKKPISPRAAKH